MVTDSAIERLNSIMPKTYSIKQDYILCIEYSLLASKFFFSAAKKHARGI